MGYKENYYRILDVPYNASLSEIKEAYRRKVKEVHPDKKKGNTEQFKRVKEAYDILENAEKRKRYDDFLFKKSQFETINQHKFKANSYPSISIIKIHRKQVRFSSVTINAALILISVLGKTYLNKKR